MAEKMGGPTQVLVSHWSAQSSKTPIPESGREKSQRERQIARCQLYLQSFVKTALSIFVVCIAFAESLGN